MKGRLNRSHESYVLKFLRGDVERTQASRIVVMSDYEGISVGRVAIVFRKFIELSYAA